MSQTIEFRWVPVPVVLENGITAVIYLKNQDLELNVSERIRQDNEIVMGVQEGEKLLDVSFEELGISFVISTHENWQNEAQKVFTELFLHRYVATIINEINMPLANGSSVGENMLKHVHQVVFY